MDMLHDMNFLSVKDFLFGFGDKANYDRAGNTGYAENAENRDKMDKMRKDVLKNGFVGLKYCLVSCFNRARIEFPDSSPELPW